MNLMLAFDRNYKFIIIDVEQYGSNAHGGVFHKSEIDIKFLNRDLSIHEPEVLPNGPQFGLLPHCIVADEAFPLW